MNKTSTGFGRILLPLLVLVGFALFPFLTYSQDEQQNTNQTSTNQTSTDQKQLQPTAANLLRVPVGGSHVPSQSAIPSVMNPYANDKNSIAQGAKLFNAMNCVGCHASQGGGGMGPPLSDSQWIYGGKPEQIFLTIAQGRPNGMPAFGRILPDAEIWKLVSYVQTLSEPQGKAAP